MMLQYATYCKIVILLYRHSSTVRVSYREASGDSQPYFSTHLSFYILFYIYSLNFFILLHFVFNFFSPKILG